MYVLPSSSVRVLVCVLSPGEKVIIVFPTLALLLPSIEEEEDGKDGDDDDDSGNTYYFPRNGSRKEKKGKKKECGTGPHAVHTPLRHMHVDGRRE